MSTEQQRRIMRLPEVCERVGLRKTAIYGRIKDHTFPSPIKLGRASGWVEQEVQQWVDEQIRATRGAVTNMEVERSPAGRIAATAKDISRLLLGDARKVDCDIIESHIRAALATAQTPAGWKLVPVEPTEEMVVAFAEAWFSKARPIDDCEMNDAYAEMLAAAPAIDAAMKCSVERKA